MCDSSDQNYMRIGVLESRSLVMLRSMHRRAIPISRCGIRPNSNLQSVDGEGGDPRPTLSTLDLLLGVDGEWTRSHAVHGSTRVIIRARGGCSDSLTVTQTKRMGKSQPAKGHGGALHLSNVPPPVSRSCHQEIMAGS